MANLLKNIKKALKECGKTPKDIEFVNCDEKSFSWKEFSVLANENYEWEHGIYRNGLYVKSWLVFVGKDWWIDWRSDCREQYHYILETMPSHYNNSEPVLKSDIFYEHNDERKGE